MKRRTTVIVAAVLVLALSASVVAAPVGLLNNPWLSGALDWLPPGLQKLVADLLGIGEPGGGVVQPMGAEGPDPIIPPMDDWI